MTIDLLALAIAVVFAILGWRSGALAQCFRVAAAVVAFLAAAPVARLLQRTFAPDTTVSGPVLESVVLIVSGIGVYLAIAVAAWLLIRTLWAASDSLTVADRAGGLGLGLLKAAILIYFLVAAVAMMRGPLREVDEEDVLHVRESRLLGLVEEYNVLVPWRFGDLDRLHDAIKVDRLLERRSAPRLPARGSEASEVLESRSMRRLTGREELVEAAVNDRYYRTLADPTVREFLNDPGFVGRLRLVEWERLLGRLRTSAAQAAKD